MTRGVRRRALLGAMLALAACSPPPALLLVSASGDGQSAAVDTTLAKPLVVRALGPSGAPLAGAPVVFQVVSGDATLRASASATDATGTVAATVTFGRKAGDVVVEARAPGSQVTFRLHALQGPATFVVVVSGDAQTGRTRETLAAPLVVAVKDAYLNVIPGVVVTFSVAQGEATLVPASVATDSTGQAATRVTLGTTMGTVLVQASAAATIGAATFLVQVAGFGGPGQAQFLTTESGDGQRGRVGSTLGLPLVVLATTANHSPVTDVAVTFVVRSGMASLSQPSARSGSDGRASTQVMLGNEAGEIVIEARAPVPEGSPQVFHATAEAGVAGRLTVVGGNDQVGQIGNALAQPLTVRLSDAQGNAVPNVFVAFLLELGDATLSGESLYELTQADGRASKTLTLGRAGGPVTLRVRADGVSADPVTFRALALAEPVGALNKLGDRQRAALGQPLANPLTVIALDGAGARRGGLVVDFAVTSGGGSVAPARVTTDADGVAQTRFTLGPNAGAHTVSATGGGGSVVFGASAQTRWTLGYVETLRNGMAIEDIPYGAADILLHGFLLPSEDGRLAESGNFTLYARRGLVGAAHGTGARVLLSIGGATGSGVLSGIAADSAKRATFVSQAVSAVLSGGYDGADLDWEFPRTTADRANLTTLLGELRAAVKAQNPGHIVTFGISTGRWLDGYDFPSLKDVSDFAFLFGYDWNSPACGPMTSTESYTTAGGTVIERSVRGALSLVLARGYPAAKLVVGLPFYSSRGESWFSVRQTWLDGLSIGWVPDPASMEVLIDGSWWTTPESLARKLAAVLSPSQSVLPGGATLGGVGFWEFGHQGGFSDLSDGVRAWLEAH